MDFDLIVQKLAGGKKPKPKFIRDVYANLVKLPGIDPTAVDFRTFCQGFTNGPKGDANEGAKRSWNETLSALFLAFDHTKQKTIDVKELVVGLNRYSNNPNKEKLKFAFMLYDGGH